MATQLFDLATADLTESRRTLLLVWQDPESRKFVRVGQLDALPHARVAFHYLPAASLESGFVPLVDYPDLTRAYISDEVPAFFANRILSADRPNYARYLEWLGVAGLDSADIPFEVLARTGGGRATDTFHVVDLPIDHDDSFSSRFFVSGVRHSLESDAVIAALESGAALQLKLEEDNPANPKAVLIDDVGGRKVGYVPDWLCGEVHDRLKAGWIVTAVAEQVNPSAPAHVRVLARLQAHRG